MEVDRFILFCYFEDVKGHTFVSHLVCLLWKSRGFYDALFFKPQSDVTFG